FCMAAAESSEPCRFETDLRRTVGKWRDAADGTGLGKRQPAWFLSGSPGRKNPLGKFHCARFPLASAQDLQSWRRSQLDNHYRHVDGRPWQFENCVQEPE